MNGFGTGTLIFSVAAIAHARCKCHKVDLHQITEIVHDCSGNRRHRGHRCDDLEGRMAPTLLDAVTHVVVAIEDGVHVALRVVDASQCRE